MTWRDATPRDMSIRYKQPGACRISWDMLSAHCKAKFCTLQSQILKINNIARIWNGWKWVGMFMHSNGFLAGEITEIPIFHFVRHLPNPVIQKLRNAVMLCMTYKLRNVACTWRSQVLQKKKILNAFAMGGNEYAFLCTVTAFWLSKSLKFHFFSFFNGIYETLSLKKLCNTMMSCMTYKLRHVVCTWRSQILRKKNITRIRNGRETNMHFYAQ